jgi:cellulose synthase/poly-beta-1,6-N-acetylglucosamine synthase-like glycosyltransferase
MSIYLDILFGLIYFYIAVSIAYLAVFSLASQCKRKEEYLPASPRFRFLILFPAYKEDTVICESVKTALRQDYPSQLFKVSVLADHMQEETLDKLLQSGADVINIQCENSSKAKALSIAMQHYDSHSTGDERYDYVVVLDADNEIFPNYLQQINDYLSETHERVVQTHRKAKNLNTPTAILDAVIEEMNNSIFRAGHVRLGISSALIGSGMVLDYEWFSRHIGKACTAGEDKELEEMLLREQIHIGYAAHIEVLDEKVQQKDVLRQQRRRWVATQIHSAQVLWRRSGEALVKGNIDYLLKAIEAIIPPRSLLLAVLFTLCIVRSLTNPLHAIAWWTMWLILIFSLYFAIPKGLRAKSHGILLRQVPSFIGIMLGNLFHLKGASRKFIHTRHG